MIVVARCPYRISLLGGSSDLDWFVNSNKRGLSIGFSIEYFSRVVLTYRDKSYLRGILNYSSREEYTNIDGISHPIIRTTLKKLSIQKPLELSSFGDSIGGSGLGSSSAFTAALIKGISKLNNKEISNSKVAHIASEIEINDLCNPIGRQDQYLCSLGGINFLEFKHPSKVTQLCKPELIKPIENFVDNLYIVNTKITRSANENLRILKDEKTSFSSIKKILELADRFIADSEGLSTLEIENLLNSYMLKAWNIKKNMVGILNEELINIEKKLEENGFNVLKLLGAGGGGYFLVRYTGKELNNATFSLKKQNLELENIIISKEGCVSWKC